MSYKTGEPLGRRHFLKFALAGVASTRLRAQETNLAEELGKLVDDNYERLPTFANTNYGSLSFRRSEETSIPTAYGAVSGSDRFDSTGALIKSTMPRAIPEEPFIGDRVSLRRGSASVNVSIYRTDEPLLVIDYSQAFLSRPLQEPERGAREIYLDTDFDGIPNRGYKSDGGSFHGIPNSATIDLDVMSTDEANFFRQHSGIELKNAIAAINEHLSRNQ
jgi:hypothetical protein